MTRQTKWIKAHPWYQKLWYRKNKKKCQKQMRKRYRRRIKRYKEIRQAIRQRNIDIIQQFKHEPCMDCHKRFDPFIMHFDHRNPDTKFRTVSQMTSYSVQKLLTEISKCDLVCANCHGLRTKAGIKNGTISLFGWKYKV